MIKSYIIRYKALCVFENMVTGHTKCELWTWSTEGPQQIFVPKQAAPGLHPDSGHRAEAPCGHARRKGGVV